MIKIQGICPYCGAKDKIQLIDKVIYIDGEYNRTDKNIPMCSLCDFDEFDIRKINNRRYKVISPMVMITLPKDISDCSIDEIKEFICRYEEENKCEIAYININTSLFNKIVNKTDIQNFINYEGGFVKVKGIKFNKTAITKTKNNILEVIKLY